MTAGGGGNGCHGETRSTPSRMGWPWSDSEMQMPGIRLIEDRFVLLEEVGSGRMSTVFVAEDAANDGLRVAVKVLNTAHDDAIKRELFKRETTALRKLRHPNVVSMREQGWWADEGAFYVVLDYHPFSLEQVLRGESGAPAVDFHPIMRQLAEGLGHAHSEGVVHRDIKPSNVLIDSAGRALLTDFGISKLTAHLTVGETLAGYWSAGYAAPEQHRGEPVSFASDVYSLGAVFFHMLSGGEPPPEGPGPPLIAERIGPPFRRVLQRMLAMDPRERPSTGADLMLQLDAGRRSEPLPTYPLLLTRNAFADLSSEGYIGAESVEEAGRFLLEELGGEEAEEVHVLGRIWGGEREVVVVGDSIRLICAVSAAGDGLVCKTVQSPYDPYLQRDRQGAMRRRAVWAVADARDGRAAPGNRQDVQALLGEITAFEAAEAVAEKGKRSKWEYVEAWLRVLRESRSRIEKQGRTLKYARAQVDRDYVRFELAQTAPDDLDWQDDTPLAARVGRESALVPVGNLVDVQGRNVLVARQRYQFQREETPVPASGYVAVNTTEALTEIRRRQRAVDAFRFDQMANPTLAGIIVDPSGCTQMTKRDLAFFQDWLSEDKREVVRRAVSTNDVFLIQGPPGTGKTSVIAEIVLQILKRNPESRILLSSQSNVAVDHALTQIAAAAGESPPEMVRIGRPERIGRGGQRWTLGERTQAWRKDVLAHCAPVEEDLRRAEREARRAMKEATRAEVMSEASTGNLEEWIAEASEIAEQLNEYGEEYALLGEDTATGNRADVKQLVDEARSEFWDHLAALNELLPKGVELSGLSELDALGSITAAAASLDDRSASESAEAVELDGIQEKRRILKHWTKVVGRSKDFEDLVSKTARIVAATCSISAKVNPRFATDHASFEWVIVDEAGRATVPEVLIPIGMAQRVILVGDKRQLPPMVDESLGRSGVDEGSVALETSLFQDLLEQDVERREHVATLETQYRMHPAIGNLISGVFYEGALVNGEPGRRRKFADSFPAVVNWISTSRLRDRGESRSGDSYENPAEARVVAAVLDRVRKDGGWKGTLRVGVIAGYRGQVGRLRGVIDTSDSSRWPRMTIEIATVDSFQGRECDVVIYSTVRSNRSRRIGFLRDYRRINVALSRARDLLVIVGDDFMMENAMLGTASNPFAEVLDRMRSNRDECRIVGAEKWP